MSEYILIKTRNFVKRKKEPQEGITSASTFRFEAKSDLFPASAITRFAFPLSGAEETNGF